MSDSESVRPGNREARQIVGLLFLATLITILVLTSNTASKIIFPVLYAIPFLLILGLFSVTRLLNSGREPAPKSAVIIGMIFLFGGPFFDIYATLYHTPDLRYEGNEIARLLLDSHHSLTFVMAYGLFCQILNAMFHLSLWIAFLRHRTTIAASLAPFSTPMTFVKAATGGSQLTWRQWCLPFTWSELPQGYYVCWVSMALILAAVVDRWYLGLEWFQLVPRVRWYVAGTAMAIGLTVYFVWLWRASRQPVQQSSAVDEPIAQL